MQGFARERAEFAVGDQEPGVAVAKDEPDRTGVELQAAAGTDAILCGSAVSAAEDPAAAVRALVGVARVCRP